MSSFFWKNNFFVLFLFILALVPRVTAAFFSDQVLSGDEIDYSQLAVRILEGKPYQSMAPFGFANVRPPLYPLFIAIIYFFTDQSIFAVKIAQALLGAGISIVIFFIAETIFKDRRINFWSGFIWALYPLSIFIGASLMSETLFTFLLALAILFLLKGYDGPDLKADVFSGLFLGLAALARPVLLAFAPFLILWLILFSTKGVFSKVKRTAMVMLFVILTIMPWTIRNYVVFKEFVPISTGGGLAFYTYNNEKILSKIFDPVVIIGSAPLTDEQKEGMSRLSEPQRDKYLYRLVWKFAKSHPKDFFKIRLISIKQFWHLWPETPARYKIYYAKEGARRNPLLDKLADTYLLYFIKILYHLPYDILFIGMFISFFVLVRKRDEFRKSLFLIFLLIAMTLLYSMVGADRYRLPTDPYVFILGLHGIFSFWKKK